MRFDSQAFGKDLLKLMKIKIKDLIKEILTSMQREAMGVYGLPNDWIIDLRNALRLSVTSEGNEILAKVGLCATGQPDDRTLFIGYISNYGMGQYADRNNPDLSDYKKSRFYNTIRGSDMYIYTRRDKYFDVDSGTWKINSKRSKWNSDITNTPPTIIEPYGRHLGFYWYENALKLSGDENGIKDKIQDMLKESVRELNKDLSKYIILN